MPSWPTPAQCRALYVELGAPDELVRHVEAVSVVAQSVARQIQANGHSVDQDLIAAAAWLHDIGRTRSNGLDHAYLGADELRRRGFDETLCRIVERHTGAGITPEEAKLHDLPPRPYVPRTEEEKIVCHADNLVDRDRRQKVQEELDDLRNRGLDDVAIRMRRLHDELSLLAGRDLDTVT